MALKALVVGFRFRAASVVRWGSMGVTTSGGIAAETFLAKRIARGTPTELPLSGVTRHFLAYWTVLVLTAIAIQLPLLPRRVRQLVVFFHADYEDRDRAGLASILGPVTRWHRRMVISRGAALVIGLAAVASMAWGTTLHGLWLSLRDPNHLHGGVLPYLSYVKPTASWLLILAAIVFWISHRVLALGFPTLPPPYRYRVRSSRLRVAFGRGVRSGLAALAWLVQLTPVVMLAYFALIANPSSANLLRWVMPDWLRRATGDGLRAITFHPAASALLLGTVPIALLVALYWALERSTALDAGDWSLASDISSVLYLRTWDADRIRMRSCGLRRGILEQLAPPRSVSFAEVIGTSLEALAPVIATAEPGGKRLLGVGAVWSSNEEWRENVRIRASDALCVVLTADKVVAESGFSWEIEMIGSGQATDRIALVLPPGLTAAHAQKPGGFLSEVARLPMFRDLDVAELDANTRVLVREADGSWYSHYASIETDLAYYLCIMDGIDRRKDDWEIASRPMSGERLDQTFDTLSTVSEDRFARGVALDGEPLGTLRLRIFYKFATSKLGRRYMAWIESNGP